MSKAKADDPRLGSIVAEGRGGRVVIVGFPFDEGCVRNGGRPGASAGPAAFRRFLHGMGAVVNAEFGVDLRGVAVSDAGDVAGATLEEAHAALGAVVEDILRRGGVPFVVGGGNDQSAPNGLALFRAAAAAVDVVNIDAHLDVRPLLAGDPPHSGSPFFQLLSSAHWAATPGDFTEFGCQGGQCSASHVAWLEQRGGRCVWHREVAADAVGAFGAVLRPPAGAARPLFVSFDIDSIQGSDCPGVSCPATVGLTAGDALGIARAAGREPRVALVDLSELNPTVEGYRTPRLAVNILYHFLLGFASRQVGT